MNRTGLAEESNETSPKITFNAQINHREGPYNSPTKTFRENPYTNRPALLTHILQLQIS